MIFAPPIGLRTPPSRDRTKRAGRESGRGGGGGVSLAGLCTLRDTGGPHRVPLDWFTGGAVLNMGDTYLMESIAVVVPAGTSVAGAQANAVGIWGAALFFNLMAIMLSTFHLEAGVRLLLTGVLIILIVSIVPRTRTS
jgi:hypothetical protein